MSKQYMNEEINYIRLYRPKPLLLQGFITPFIALYGIWISFWISNLGLEDYLEAGLIVIAIIAILQILTCLFCYWFVAFRCWMSCYLVDNIESASLVEVVPVPNNGYPELVTLHKELEPSGIDAWFIFQKVKYSYDIQTKGNFKEVAYQTNLTFKHYSENKGYTDDEISRISKLYGFNSLQMDIPPFSELFKERATAPFFVFQVFCVGLWCLDEYWYYSIFTLLMLIAFEATLVQQQLRNMAEIRKMGNKPYIIQVYRNRRWRPIISDQLLPGDIISLGRSQDDNFVPCDLLLLRGSCIVDESMLTGESVPVMKEPIENEDYSTCLNFDMHGKLHILFGGTKIIQNSSPNKNSTGLKAPDNGCLAFVLRHGFGTSQGKLLRTILFGVKRVTANNFETFMFILFLLIFAIIAAVYVWVHGSANPARNKYKLFLECALILTSVVPPELPIELSLAVNNSLLALTKLYVFCTEPFRIPFAGKIDICCFDKTGTLTSDDLIVQGIAGLKENDELINADITPLETQQVLATCHSLIYLEDCLVGDPLEKITLQAINWNLTKADAVVPRRGNGLKIYQRFHFSSLLRCMSVIAGQTVPGSTDIQALATIKGAPEIVRNMLKVVPNNYDETFKRLARQGSRVLTLAYKSLGVLSNHQIKELTRPMLEDKLDFAGFLVISCPLKPDSKAVIKEIKNASHHIVMITGDNALTACHVSSELRISKKQPTLILTQQLDMTWIWKSIDESIFLPIKNLFNELEYLFNNYNLCLTGEGLLYLSKYDLSYFEKILPHVKIFSRVAPKQKEFIITSFNRLGFITLMCGDGTNDVGALKHAHVGVALLTNAPTFKSMKKPELNNGSSVDSLSPQKSHSKTKLKNSNEKNPLSPPLAQQTKKLSDRLKQLEEEERAQVVRLGDASIAAPFTSKLSTALCVCHIIKQGRCTLVTTLQMFKILALNALILAYSQSVLYLDGVKFSDTQATMQGLLLAGCFLFISRSKPLDILSPERPLPNIFNLYTVLTIVCQFFVHFFSLVNLKSASESFSPNRTEEFVDLEAKFSPNLINSTIYVLAIAMQITTFVVNYKGHPFMASLFENRPLLYSLIVSAGVTIGLSAGIFPDIADQLELVEFIPELRNIILTTLFSNFVGCLVVDRILQFIFCRSTFNDNQKLFKYN